MTSYTFDNIETFVGQEMGVSDWLTMEQDRINQFADCTGDHQWIHVDVERAKTESPFGTTIAHGFLTLSLLPYFQEHIGVTIEGIAQTLNYGTNKVRFMAPVKVGDRIRDRMTLQSVDDKGAGRKLLSLQHTVEIDGEDKPAMVAEMLALIMQG